MPTGTTPTTGGTTPTTGTTNNKNWMWAVILASGMIGSALIISMCCRGCTKEPGCTNCKEQTKHDTVWVKEQAKHDTVWVIKEPLPEKPKTSKQKKRNNAPVTPAPTNVNNNTVNVNINVPEQKPADKQPDAPTATVTVTYEEVRRCSPCCRPTPTHSR